jgi:hypothetical protein
MKFPVRIETRGAEYVAHSVAEPVCSVKAPSQTEAIEKIRREIRYRIELCPCTGVEDDFVEIVIV